MSTGLVLAPGLCCTQWCFLKAEFNTSLRELRKSSQNKVGMDNTHFNWGAALNSSHGDVSWKREKGNIRCRNLTHGGSASLRAAVMARSSG